MSSLWRRRIHGARRLSLTLIRMLYEPCYAVGKRPRANIYALARRTAIIYFNTHSINPFTRRNKNFHDTAAQANNISLDTSILHAGAANRETHFARIVSTWKIQIYRKCTKGFSIRITLCSSAVFILRQFLNKIRRIFLVLNNNRRPRNVICD